MMAGSPSGEPSFDAIDKGRKSKYRDEAASVLNAEERRRNAWISGHIKMKVTVGDEVHVKPTDCFGDIDFKETTKRSKAKFIRLAEDTTPCVVFDLLMKQWKLEAPRLIISVTGGAKSLDIDPQMKKNFTDGLLKVANTPGAWVISGGTNTGVMKLVGDAMHGTDNVCIGIVTWGVVAKKESLQPDSGVGNPHTGGVFPYRLGSYLVEDGAFLDYNHSHFLLVDDGSDNQYGREIDFRAKLEEYIMIRRKDIMEKYKNRTKSSRAKGKEEKHKEGKSEERLHKVPTVLLVLEGGPGTLGTVHSAVTNTSPIPCVVVKGSGRAADLLVYALSVSEEIVCIEDGCEGGECPIEKTHKGLQLHIIKTFPELAPNEAKDSTDEKEMKNKEKREDAYSKVVDCVRMKDMFTIADYTYAEMDVDDSILTALLNDRYTPSHYEQLRLTMLWDRVDLAEQKILSPMTKWKGNGEELHWLMIMALAMDRIAFVKLLLDYGVSIKQLLTDQVLQFLYTYRLQKGNSTMKYQQFPEDEFDNVVLDNKGYTRVFSNLLSFDSCKIRNSVIQLVPRYMIEDVLRLVLHRFPKDIIKQHWNPSEPDHFEYPFRELFFWAVLNNMLEMAVFLWKFEEEAMAKAAEMSNGLIMTFKLRDLPDEVEAGMVNTASTFTRLSIQLLDACYQADESDTEEFITDDLDMLPGMTCLDLAIASEQEDFVAHSAVQGMLSDRWTGAIVQRHVTPSTILMGFLYPPSVRTLDIDSDEKVNVNAEEVNSDAEEGNSSGEEVQSNVVVVRKKKKKRKKKYVLRTASEVRKFQSREKVPFHKKYMLFIFHSPIVRFYGLTIGYIMFLCLFAYVAMLKKPTTTPGWAEILLIVTVAGYAVCEVYQITHMEATTKMDIVLNYVTSFWNLFDLMCLIMFLIAFILRLIQSTLQVGHLFYALDVSLWIVRLIEVLYMHSISGPYVVMIGRMFRDMMYFLVILFIFLLGYGIAVTAILKPQQDDAQMFIKSIFHPYFHIHGEYFVDRDRSDINTTRFGEPSLNDYAEPIVWLYLGVYLLIANILLLNLLIAIFNNTYASVMLNANRIWKFQRYGLIVEYSQQRVATFPPFSLIQHGCLTIRYLLDKCGLITTEKFIPGLKSHVTKKNKENGAQLRAFENNCLIKLVREKGRGGERSLQDVAENLSERVDEISLSLIVTKKAKAKRDGNKAPAAPQSTEEKLLNKIDYLQEMISQQIQLAPSRDLNSKLTANNLPVAVENVSAAVHDGDEDNYVEIVDGDGNGDGEASTMSTTVVAGDDEIMFVDIGEI